MSLQKFVCIVSLLLAAYYVKAQDLHSKGLNLAEIDRVPDEIMNNMVWKAVKGENAKLPTPIRAAFVKAAQKKEDD